jgi:hypothetical protein
MAEKMDKIDIASACKRALEAADEADKKDERLLAMKFYDGETDVPTAPNRSKVVSHDVADSINTLLPQVMRVFTGSGLVARVNPRRKGQEAMAAEATPYLNYVFMELNGGFRTIHDAAHDGLLLRNGIIKTYVETRVTHKLVDYEGITDEQLDGLLADVDDDTEATVVKKKTERHEIEVTGEEAAMTVLDPANETHLAMSRDGKDVVDIVKIHDVTIRYAKTERHHVSRAMPRDEFRIAADATSLADKPFCAHVYTDTVGALVAQGFDEDDIEGLASSGTRAGTNAEKARRYPGKRDGQGEDDDSSREVEISECYIWLDTDGDGVLEYHRCILGGTAGGASNSGAYELLDDTEVDDNPFADLNPRPLPHQFEGRSVADETMDIQRVKSVLKQQTLDNIYHQNNPQREAVQDAILDPEQLLEPEMGQVIWTKREGAVRELPTNYIANNSFSMLDYMDGVKEQRLGINKQSAGLDPEALSNQTATAVQSIQAASQSSTDLIVRSFAEGGLTRALTQLLNQLIAEATGPVTAFIQGAWEEFDPTKWDSDMNVSVDIGLGMGNRDRDMATLGQVLTWQKELLQEMGPTGPITTIQEYAETLGKFVEASGLKNPEAYFTPVTDEELAKITADAEEAAEAAKQQKDPVQVQADALVQVEQIKAQSSIKNTEAKLAKELELERDKLGAEIEYRKWEYEQKQMAKLAEARIDQETDQFGLTIKAETEVAKAQIAARAKGVQ